MHLEKYSIVNFTGSNQSNTNMFSRGKIDKQSFKKQCVAAASSHQCFGFGEEIAQVEEEVEEIDQVEEEEISKVVKPAAQCQGPRKNKLSQTFIYLVYFQRVFYVKLNLT